MTTKWQTCPPLQLLTQLLPDVSALPAWQSALLSGDIPASGRRLAFWHRTAPHTHEGPTAAFHCPICSCPCPGWGAHLLADCPTAVVAALRGFQSVAEHLQASGQPLLWQTPTSFLLGEQRWQLMTDHTIHLTAGAHPWAIGVTWSGLIWTRPPHTVPTPLRCALIVAFLQSAATWLHQPPASRWSSLTHGHSAGADHPLSPIPVLGTILQHLLPPATSVSGPQAHLVGCILRPAVPAPQPHQPPSVSISCGTLPAVEGPQPRPCYISLLPSPPPTTRTGLLGQLLQAPGDTTLYVPRCVRQAGGPLPAHLAAQCVRSFITSVPPSKVRRHPNLCTSRPRPGYMPNPPTAPSAGTHAHAPAHPHMQFRLGYPAAACMHEGHPAEMGAV